MAWLLPELDVGVEPELRPLELELEPVELEPVEPEPELDEVPELELAELPEPDDAEEVTVLCVDPGRAKATAPAAATLAMVTAVVAERTLARPCALAATAWRTRSRCALLMASFCGQVLGAFLRNLLGEL